MSEDNRRILLVEDEVLIGIATAQSLEDESFAVTTATSGEKAVSLVKESPGAFDLILMDIDLGRGMDGTEAASEILKIRNIPVIFLSSHTEKDMVNKTESISSYGYVVKHSGISVLAASIRMAFRLHDAYTAVEQKTVELTGVIGELQTASEELEAANEQLIESESELQKSEARIRSTMDSLMEGCQIISRDWRYLYLNRSAEIYGRKKTEDLIGKTIFECYPGIREQELFGILSDCMEKNVSCRKELSFRFDDGSLSVFEFEIQPVPEGLFILTTETTERYRILQKISESEHRFRILVENAPTGVFIQTKGRFAYINPALKRMLEIDDETKILGRPILDFVAERDRETVVERIRKLNIDKEEQPTLEETLITLSGAELKCEIYGVPVFYEEENGALVYVYNIGSRKEKEDELRRQMDLKDTLMVELQHRVKNSLSLVSSLVSLETSAIEDDSVRMIFDKTQSRIQTMAGIYEMLYRSPGNGTAEVRLDNYIRNLSSAIINLFGNDKKIGLSCDLDEIVIDLKRVVLICLILNELIMNSIKHGCISSDDGIIRIELKRLADRFFLNISNGASCEMSDEGYCGGIGLSLVNLLIRELRGEMTVRHDPGFTVRILIPEALQP
jgi:PAS domain S-box-containing protein